MAAGSHFGCPKITLYHISYGGPFWMSEKITFDLISGHFRSIRNFIFFWKFLTKWLPSAILDVRNSLWIAFLAILDQYRFLIFFKIFEKMADVGHFGCLNFTFDHISGHFRSICNLNFVRKFWAKWLPSPILDFRNSLSIAFLAISDRSAILDFLNSLSIAILAIRYNFFSRGHFGCLKITLDRISGHFRLIGHFGCPKFTFDGISGHFRSIRNLIFFLIFDKMTAGGNFGCPQITFDHISGHFHAYLELFQRNIIIQHDIR